MYSISEQTSTEQPAALNMVSKEDAQELQSDSWRSGKQNKADDRKEVVLHAEVMTAKHHRPMQVVLAVMLLISFLALIYALIFKTKQKQSKLFQRPYVQKTNVVFGSICLFVLSLMLAAFLRNTILIAKDRKVIWTQRKKFSVALAFIQLLFQFINVVFFIAPNAYSLAHTCGWFDKLVYTSTYVRWSCWNTIFLVLSIHAHNISPWLNSDGSYKRGRQASVTGQDRALIIADSAWWIHLPKFAIWLLFEVAIIVLVARYPNQPDFNLSYPPDQDALPCTMKDYMCRTRLSFKVWTTIWILGLLLFVFVIMSYARQARTRLRQQPYNAYVESQMMGLWMKQQIWMVAVLGASTVPLLWYTHWDRCNNYFMAWLGLLPLQMIVTTTTVVNAYYFLPMRPGDDALLQEWLQDFAWTEASLQEQLKWRAERTSNASIAKKLRQEPLFCFETAVKLLLWSELVYKHDELPPERKQALTTWYSWCPCMGGRAKNTSLEIDAEDNSPTQAAHADESAQSGREDDSSGPAHQQDPSRIANGESITNGDSASCGRQDLRSSSAAIVAKQDASRLTNGDLASFGRQDLESSPAAIAAKQDPGGARRAEGSASSLEVESAVGKASACCLGGSSCEEGASKGEGSGVEVEKEEGVSCEELLQSAMEMYSLEHFRVLHEELLETRVLVAWSGTTLLLSFRGTAAMANVISDAKAWRTCHLPKRGKFLFGKQPMVHLGFYQSWLVNGLNLRILQLVKEVLAKASVPLPEFRVYLTGHSLGGALATLAAIDIQKAFQLPRLHVYTFGAPRTGNHAFAKEYATHVPHTWHVINDRDAVPRSGKFVTMYKRPGQRVLINNVGDIRVRPSALEVCMHTSGFSVAQHYLAAYLGALVSICTTQCMRHKALPFGRRGVERLAASPPVCTYLATGGLDLDALLQLPPEEVCLPNLRPADSNKQRGCGILWLLQAFAEELLPAGENALATLTLMADGDPDAEEQAKQPLQARVSALNQRRSSLPIKAAQSTVAVQLEEV